MKMVLTGGGSSGHVSPLLAVATELVDSHVCSQGDVVWLGSAHGLEGDLVRAAGYAFHGCATGKMRRYSDWRNVIDLLKVPVGLGQTLMLLRNLRPSVILSSGGYVSVPVITAATILRIPVVLYESNTIPGLTMRLLMGRAKAVCLGFPDTARRFPHKKSVVTGHAVRSEVMDGKKENGYRFTGFTAEKPVVLAMGGSQGAAFINEHIRAEIGELTKFCQIVHSTGPGNIDHALDSVPGYKQYEYLHGELSGIYAITTLAVSRAGANSIAECAANHIPSILIPLPTAAENHQRENARVCEQRGAAVTMEQDTLHGMRLTETIQKLLADHARLKTMGTEAGKLANHDAAKKIVDILKQVAK